MLDLMSRNELPARLMTLLHLMREGCGTVAVAAVWVGTLQPDDLAFMLYRWNFE